VSAEEKGRWPVASHQNFENVTPPSSSYMTHPSPPKPLRGHIWGSIIYGVPHKIRKSPTKIFRPRGEGSYKTGDHIRGGGGIPAGTDVISKEKIERIRRRRNIHFIKNWWWIFFAALGLKSVLSDCDCDKKINLSEGSVLEEIVWKKEQRTPSPK